MTIDYYESEKISVPYKYYFSTHFTSAASLGELATVGDYLDPYLIATKKKMKISGKNVSKPHNLVCWKPEFTKRQTYDNV